MLALAIPVAHRVSFFDKGVMRPMSTNLITSGESRTWVRSRTIDSKAKRTWIQFLPLVFLILIELGGMVLLCYKCEHPAEVSIFQER